VSRQATARRPVTTPRVPRRVSGPVAPPKRPQAVPSPPQQQKTTGALRTVSDHRWLDSLLRSRAWIWIVGVGLGGIVAMQVSLLKLNTGISRAVESAATLERQNAELEVEVAKLSSVERIRVEAEKRGLVMPDASHVKWLHSRGDRDAPRAARRMAPPTLDAQKLMANGGRVPPGTLTATMPAAQAAPVAAQPAPAPEPAAPAPTATPAPVATAQPTAPAAQPVGTTEGGQAAPQG
jgi:cell division protein FtsL